MIDMRTLVERNGSTVIVGHEESMASLVLYQMAFELMAGGCPILQLLDFQNENVKAFASVYCTELELPKTLLDNYYIMDNYRLHHTPALLAAAIKKLVPNLRPVVIFNNLANHVVATTPQHPWLKIAQALPKQLDCAVITSVCYGSSAQPAPPMAEWPAEQLWECTPGRNFGVRLTEYRPSDRVVRVEGKNYLGGLTLFTQIEEPTNAG